MNKNIRRSNSPKRDRTLKCLEAARECSLDSAWLPAPARKVRMYAGSDNRSHIEDLAPDIELGPAATKSGGSAGSLEFVYQPAGYTIPMHPAPRRQYLITLQGRSEVEIGDGTIQSFGLGDVMLAEDTHGKGHITRVVGSLARISAQISLNE
ncbi:MAG: hypothetical protein FI680_03805 [SAR202 cluster bacterium]|nr:hypothetical protein [SAR202 cluster bacterium]